VKLPAGVRDWLPHELRRKREIESRVRGVFGRWSYEEVQTPGFERFDVLQLGLGERLAEQTFRFYGRTGTLLALRPEMTTPIARLVSTRMRDAPLPLRLAYVAPAYRYEEPQEGRMREFTQAGVEIIGEAGVDADAETLFMAFETLDEMGLRDAQIDINHAAVVDGVLAATGLDHDEAVCWKTLIAQRNLVELRARAAARRGALRADALELLLELATMRGCEELIARAGSICRTAGSVEGLERLRTLLARARALGYGQRTSVDFALLRDLEYYTGFVFEGYVADLGFSLCGGGRYDSLLPRFGYEVPAVGWMASVERLLIALERRRLYVDRRRRPRTIDVLVSGSDLIAARERAAGNVVRAHFGVTPSEEELAGIARAAHIPRVIIANDGSVREVKVTW
jgi:ATP phosphoribosyltransferase regulatory subunit